METFQVVLQDTDGDSATSTLTVKVVDDAPETTSAQNLIVDLQTKNIAMFADLGIKIGADLTGALVNISTLTTGSKVLTSDGYQLASNQNLLTWSTRTDGGLDAVRSDGSVAFTVKPAIVGGEAVYSLEIFQPIDPKVSASFNLANSVSVGGGNTPSSLEVTNTDGTKLRITGYENNGATEMRTDISNTGWKQAPVNSSTQGIGVANQFVTNSETSKNADKIGQ